MRGKRGHFGSVSILRFRITQHQILCQRPQQHFLFSSCGFDRPQAVAEVAFDHAESSEQIPRRPRMSRGRKGDKSIPFGTANAVVWRRKKG